MTNRIQKPCKKVIWNKRISEICLTDDGKLFKIQDLPSLCYEQKEFDIFPGKTNITPYQLKNFNENNINHTEEVIIGSEQGTTFSH